MTRDEGLNAAGALEHVELRRLSCLSEMYELDQSSTKNTERLADLHADIGDLERDRFRLIWELYGDVGAYDEPCNHPVEKHPGKFYYCDLPPKHPGASHSTNPHRGAPLRRVGGESDGR